MPHFTMNPLHCWISSLWLLLCLTAFTSGAASVTGFEGQDVILPCKYDSVYNGVCDVCWMRGSIPNNGCGTQIIYANEKDVVVRDDVRYRLNGALKNGDASLTIRNARQSDSGKYGCRIHVPGWFNDIKIEVYLNIRKATTTTTTTTTHIPTHVHSTMQHETTTIPETTTRHTETQTYSTTGYVTTTTPVPTEGPDSTIQDKTSTIPENVTTERAGPISTVHEETTTVPEYVTTNEKETQQTSTTLQYATTTTHSVTHGPDSTIQDETTIVPEHVTTKETGYFATDVISENYPDPEFMNKDTDVLPAILVPVLLISLGFGIFAVYLMSKHKRRCSTTLEIAKTSSSSVSYSNLANSVTLPMTDSTNN